MIPNNYDFSCHLVTENLKEDNQSNVPMKSAIILCFSDKA